MPTGLSSWIADRSSNRELTTSSWPIKRDTILACTVCNKDSCHERTLSNTCIVATLSDCLAPGMAPSQTVGHTESACPRKIEEHTSELQSLMRNSYAVFCLQKKQSKLTNIQHP